jgi:tRNA1Val (adenine37-N6)-methyltransferase
LIVLPDQNSLQNGTIRLDSLFEGKLVCRQPRHGYRYSVDSILLAHFSPPQSGDSVLDLGCGCGIIGLIMLFRWRARCKRLVGLEIQPELAELARENGQVNGFGDAYSVVEGDIRTIQDYFPAESFSRVVCNPPYYAPGTGRENDDRQSVIARHQVCASTDQIMAAASLVVKNRGVVSVVFPADGLVDLLGAMVAANLRPKRMQMIYSYPNPDGAAALVLVEAMKNGGSGAKILPPFYIYQEKNGNYSHAMQRLYDIHQERQHE